MKKSYEIENVPSETDMSEEQIVDNVSESKTEENGSQNNKKTTITSDNNIQGSIKISDDKSRITICLEKKGVNGNLDKACKKVLAKNLETLKQNGYYSSTEDEEIEEITCSSSNTISSDEHDLKNEAIFGKQECTNVAQIKQSSCKPDDSSVTLTLSTSAAPKSHSDRSRSKSESTASAVNKSASGKKAGRGNASEPTCCPSPRGILKDCSVPPNATSKRSRSPCCVTFASLIASSASTERFSSRNIKASCPTYVLCDGMGNKYESPKYDSGCLVSDYCRRNNQCCSIGDWNYTKGHKSCVRCPASLGCSCPKTCSQPVKPKDPPDPPVETPPSPPPPVKKPSKTRPSPPTPEKSPNPPAIKKSSSKTLVKTASSDKLVKKPSSKTVVKTASSDKLVKKPSSKTVVKTASSDKLVKKPSSKTVVKTPSADKIAKKVSSKTLVKTASSDKLVKPVKSASSQKVVKNVSSDKIVKTVQIRTPSQEDPPPPKQDPPKKDPPKKKPPPQQKCPSTCCHSPQCPSQQCDSQDDLPSEDEVPPLPHPSPLLSPCCPPPTCCPPPRKLCCSTIPGCKLPHPHSTPFALNPPFPFASISKRLPSSPNKYASSRDRSSGCGRCSSADRAYSCCCKPSCGSVPYYKCSMPVCPEGCATLPMLRRWKAQQSLGDPWNTIT